MDAKFSLEQKVSHQPLRKICAADETSKLWLICEDGKNKSVQGNGFQTKTICAVLVAKKTTLACNFFLSF